MGRKMTAEEVGKIQTVLNKHEFVINVVGMPIQSGIACARFLIEFVLGHYRFAETHPIVGGKAKVGVVAYDDSGFTVLE